MLVRFHSKASGSVTMFGDIAAELLRLMGMSGMVPGAVLAQDLPEALSRLRKAMASPEGDRIPRQGQGGRQLRDDEGEDGQDEKDVAQINLRTRAYPLVQMLDAAAAANADVVWEDDDKATG